MCVLRSPLRGRGERGEEEQDGTVRTLVSRKTGGEDDPGFEKE
jgi:hypothetical protein